MLILYIILVILLTLIHPISSIKSHQSISKHNTRRLVSTHGINNVYLISKTSGSFGAPLATGDTFSASIAPLSDVNNDNLDEILVGTPNDDSGSISTGCIYVIFPTTSGHVSTYTKISKTTSSYLQLSTGDLFGWSISSIGDMDNDSRDDIIIGAIGDDDGGLNYGSVYLVYTDNTAGVKTYSKMGQTSGGLTFTLTVNSRFGSDLCSMNDMDNDTVNDVLIAASGQGQGSVYLIMLQTDFTVKTYVEMTKTSSTHLNTATYISTFGLSVARMSGWYSDIDGDGIRDFITSAGIDVSGTQGSVYLVLLDSTYSVKTYSVISITSGSFTGSLDTLDYFGSDISGVDQDDYGDIDGDNVQDILVGAYGDDDGGVDKGSVYVIMLQTTLLVKTFYKISATSGSYTQSITSGDHFGGAVGSFGSDVDQDGYIDILVGSPSGTDPGGEADVGILSIISLIHPSLHTLSPTTAPTSDTSALYSINAMHKISSVSLTTGLATTDYFGSSVTSISDINGDGVDEVAMGAIGDDDAGSRTGAVYVCYMLTSGAIGTYQKISSSTSLPLDTFDDFGSSVSDIGDIDDDSVHDIVVGAVGDDDGSSSAGAVYLMLLTTSYTVSTWVKISSTSGSFTYSLTTLDYFGGSSSGLGDIDLDNIEDVIIGTNDTTQGSLYIIMFTSDLKVKSYILVDSTSGGMQTVDYTTNIGRAVSVIGGYDNDLNQDGLYDLVAGSYNDPAVHPEGAVYIMFMNTANTVQTFVKISKTSGSFTALLTTNDYFGFSLSAVNKSLYGDIDGDSVQDILVGASLDDDGGSNTGCVYIIMLNTTGLVKTWCKISSDTSLLVTALDVDDFFGWSIGSFGYDFDSDGYVDIIVGSRNDDDSASDAGAVYLFSIVHPALMASLAPSQSPVSSLYEVEGMYKISSASASFSGVITTNDFFGISCSSLSDINSDGVDDMVVGAYGDDTIVNGSGAVYVFLMSSSGGLNTYTKIDKTYIGSLTTGDACGRSVSDIYDLDGDLVNDIGIGAPASDVGGINDGALFVMLLTTSGGAKSFVSIAGTQSSFTASLGSDARFGEDVGPLGDIDSDNINDIVVGAYHDDSSAGAIYLIMLQSSLLVKSYVKINKTSGGMDSSDATTNFGCSVSPIGGSSNDLDGDGVFDLIVGSYYDSANHDEGAVYVLLMASINTVKTFIKISSGSGSLTAVLSSNDYFGYASSSVGRSSFGDINGDSIQDILVGALLDSDGGSQSGAVYIIMLHTTGLVKTYSKLSSTAGGLTGVITTGDFFGSSVSSFGEDWDGDGYIDIIVGAHRDSDPNQNDGSVFILSISHPALATPSPTTSPTQSPTPSPTNAPSAASSYDIQAMFKVSANTPGMSGLLSTNDYFGGSVAILSDLDSNGVDDLLVSAHGDDSGGSAVGAVYVLYMISSGEVQTYTKISHTSGGFTSAGLDITDRFGSSVANLSLLDSDTVNDIGVGAEDDDDGGSNAGCLYIIHLTSSGVVKTFIKISSTSGSLNHTLPSNANFGNAMSSLDDIDDDNMKDVVVGAYRNNSSKGTIFLLMLQTNSKVKTFIKIGRTSGGMQTADFTDTFGSSVSLIGGYDHDLNKDGVEDLMIGSMFDTSHHSGGAIYIMFMASDHLVNTYVKISNGVGGFTANLNVNDYFGWAISSIDTTTYGDIDGDNIQDLLAGAPGADSGASNIGDVYIVMLHTTGQVKTYARITSTESTFLTIDANDWFGVSLGSFANDYFGGDGYNDIIIGAYQDDDGSADAGAVYILSIEHPTLETLSPTSSEVYAIATSYKISSTQGSLTFGLSDNDFFGGSVAMLGDIDNDGVDDLAVGIQGDDSGGTDAGVVHILWMSSTGHVLSSARISATDGVSDISTNDSFGRSVANISDLNDDFIDDIGVGAIGDDDGHVDSGSVYIILLTSTNNIVTYTKISPTSGDFTATLTADANFGSSVTSIGDVDSDGVGDIAVGAFGDESGQGSIYLLRINTTFSVKTYYKISRSSNGGMETADFTTFFGVSIALMGGYDSDLDKDDTSDLIVGSNKSLNQTEGAIYVLFMASSGTVSTYVEISNSSGSFTASLATNDNFGYSLSSIDRTVYGDIDGDDIQDVFVGSIRNDEGGVDRGCVYIIMLNTTGSVKTYSRIASSLTGFTGLLTNGDKFGSAIASFGSDYDGDGYIDIVVGAINDDDGGSNQGALYILSVIHPSLNTFSPTLSPTLSPTALTGSVSLEIASVTKLSSTQGSITQMDADDRFGTSVAVISDLDGNGIDDMLVGVPFDDDGVSQGGAVYLIWMTSTGAVLTLTKISSTSGSFNPTAFDTNERFGFGVGNIYDLDQDLLTDIGVGAIHDDDGNNDGGCVYIINLTTMGTVDTFGKISATEGSFTYLVNDNIKFGASISAINDLDSNNVDDLAVGAYLDDSDLGSTFLLFLSTNRTVQSYVKISQTSNVETADFTQTFGYAVSSIGGPDNDLNLDTYGDLVVGAPGDSSVWVLFLSSTATVHTFISISAFSGSLTATIQSSDSFGIGVSYVSDDSSTGDIDGDSIQDILVGASEDDIATNVGAVYILMLDTSGLVKTYSKLSSATSAIATYLDTSDRWGSDVSSFGVDITGDSYLDILVGAPRDDDGAEDAGAVYIVSLESVAAPTPSPTVIEYYVVESAYKIAGGVGSFTATLNDSDYFGYSASTLSDLNGDGTDEVAVGAWLDDDGFVGAGAVYVLFMETNGAVLTYVKISATSGGFTTAALATSDYFGTSVADVDDLDGDGVSDIAVGVSRDDDGALAAGSVYIIHLQSTGIVETFVKISSTEGSFTYSVPSSAYFGSSVARIGDFDGDGMDDIAAGADGDDGGIGALHLLILQTTSKVKTFIKIGRTSGALDTADFNDNFGCSVTLVGGLDNDLNNDSTPDLVVGSYLDTTNHPEGAVYILFMTGTLIVSTHVKISASSGSFTATLASGDTFGQSAALMYRSSRGDIDGDHVQDILVGANGTEDGGPDRGAVYVVMLQTSGLVKTWAIISGSTSGFVGYLADDDNFGTSVSSFSTDIDGDGYIDIVVGAPYDDDGVSDGGAIYVLSIKHPDLATPSPTLYPTLYPTPSPTLYPTLYPTLSPTLYPTPSPTLYPTLSPTLYPTPSPTLYPTLSPTTGAPTAPYDIKQVYKISSGGGSFTGSLTASGRFGASLVAMDDMNSNGINDIIVGSPSDDAGGGNSGAIFILFMLDNGTVELWTKLYAFEDSIAGIDIQTNDTFGYSVSSIGDNNDDGVEDIGVGSPHHDDAGVDSGAVYLFYLTTSGTVTTWMKLSNTEPGFTITLATSDRFGSCITKIDDLDGNLVDDLVVGANGDETGEGLETGAIYLLLLEATGNLQSYTYLSATTGLLTMDIHDSLFGSSVCTVGGLDDDLDGDGNYDLVVGAYQLATTGAVYVMFMENNYSVKTFVQISNTSGSLTATIATLDRFGGSVSFVNDDLYGDIDGDNTQDILVGAYGDDTGGSDTGAVYIIMLKTAGSVKTYAIINDTSSGFATNLAISDTFGISVSSFGKDFDGDGYIDIVVGADGDADSGTEEGAFYILSVHHPSLTTTFSPTDSPTMSPTLFPTQSPSNSPTLSPTMTPTMSPTMSPTLSPTSIPTNTPTTSPTNSPTKSPTTSPTNTPTNTPTSSPTMSPTSLPTSSPTTSSPTMSPTSLPTSSPTTPSPTSSPTLSPTLSPTTPFPTTTTAYPTQSPTTGAPTPQPTLIINAPDATATFSSGGNLIYIEFDGDTNEIEQDGIFDCSIIFQDISSLGDSSSSECVFITSSELKVTLGANAEINVDDELIFNNDLVCSSSDSYDDDAVRYITQCISNDYTMIVSGPSELIEPEALITGIQSIGKCDDIELDGSESVSTAGRDLTYTWTLHSSLDSLDGLRTIIESNEESELIIESDIWLPIITNASETISNLTISLNVANFLGAEDDSDIFVIHVNNTAALLEAKIIGVLYKEVERGESISINGFGSIPDCIQGSDSLTLEYVWSVQSVESTSDGLSDDTELTRISEIIDDIESNDPTRLLIASHQFDSGYLYTILLTVSADLSSLDFSQDISNTASIEIEVYASDIIAVIDGGSTRTVSVIENITIDASTSIDNNDIDGSISGLNYLWMCSREDNEDCWDDDDIIVTDSTLELAPYTLVDDVEHTFTFLIYDDDGRNDSTSVLIITEEGEIPVVEISLNDDSSSKINPEDHLKLLGVAYSSSNEELTLQWSSDDLDLFDDNIVASSIDENNLVINQDVMVGGKTYTFRFTASSPIADGYSEVSVLINTAPVSGYISTDPSEGRELIDVFKLAMNDWSDDVDDYPLLYRFYYYDLDDTGAFNYLSSAAESTRLETKLPAGNATNGYYLTIGGRVDDNLGASNTDEQDIIVEMFSVQSDDTSDDNDYNSNVDLILDNEDDMDQAIRENNREALLRLVDVSGSLMNSNDSTGNREIKTRTKLLRYFQNATSLAIAEFSIIEQCTSTLKTLVKAPDQLDEDAKIIALDAVDDLVDILASTNAITDDASDNIVDSFSSLIDGGILSDEEDSINDIVDNIHAISTYKLNDLIAGQDPSLSIGDLIQLSTQIYSSEKLSNEQVNIESPKNYDDGANHGSVLLPSDLLTDVDICDDNIDIEAITWNVDNSPFEYNEDGNIDLSAREDDTFLNKVDSSVFSLLMKTCDDEIIALDLEEGLNITVEISDDVWNDAIALYDSEDNFIIESDEDFDLYNNTRIIHEVDCVWNKPETKTVECGVNSLGEVRYETVYCGNGSYNEDGLSSNEDYTLEYQCGHNSVIAECVWWDGVNNEWTSEGCRFLTYTHQYDQNDLSTCLCNHTLNINEGRRLSTTESGSSLPSAGTRYKTRSFSSVGALINSGERCEYVTDTWTSFYQSEGYYALIFTYGAAWITVLLLTLKQIRKLKPLCKLALNNFIYILLAPAAILRAVYFFVLFGYRDQGRGLACYEFAGNTEKGQFPWISFIHDLFYPLSLLIFSAISLYWLSLAKTAKESLAKLRRMTFVTGIVLKVFIVFNLLIFIISMMFSFILYYSSLNNSDKEFIASFNLFIFITACYLEGFSFYYCGKELIASMGGKKGDAPNKKFRKIGILMKWCSIGYATLGTILLIMVVLALSDELLPVAVIYSVVFHLVELLIIIVVITTLKPKKGKKSKMISGTTTNTSPYNTNASSSSKPYSSNESNNEVQQRLTAESSSLDNRSTFESSNNDSAYQLNEKKGWFNRNRKSSGANTESLVENNDIEMSNIYESNEGNTNQMRSSWNPIRSSLDSKNGDFLGNKPLSSSKSTESKKQDESKTNFLSPTNPLVHSNQDDNEHKKKKSSHSFPWKYNSKRQIAWNSRRQL